MKLVIEDSAGTRSTVSFTGDEITVGRAPEGNTVRLGDRNVSRRHARFLRQGTTVIVEDLGSLVGTRVNGEPIQGRRKLRAGDVVEIGDFDVAVLGDGVSTEDAPPPPLPPAVTPPSRITARAAEPVVKAPDLAPRAITRQLPPPIDRARTTRLAAIAGAIALLVGLGAGFALARSLRASAAPPPAARALP
jgi:pSer/pThr/pTyr-binding forkhead associated (FHA) protein